MFFFKEAAGKISPVGFFGDGSAGKVESPRIFRREAPIIRRLGKRDAGKEKGFSFSGNLNGKVCLFKIDTSSDISVIKASLAIPLRHKWVKFNRLKYPTGETVPVSSRISAVVSLAEFNVEMSLYVAEIEDECILRTDFHSKIGKVEFFFKQIFGLNKIEKEKVTRICSRIKNDSCRLPELLLQIKEQSSQHLNAFQKEVFTEFLSEFCEVFSENIVAGNCD